MTLPHNSEDDEPIGIIPANTVIQRNGSDLQAGCQSFDMLHISVKDDSPVGQIIAKWIDDAQKDDEKWQSERIAHWNSVNRVTERLRKKPYILTEEPKQYPMLLTYWNKGVRKIELTNQDHLRLSAVTSRWKQFWYDVQDAMTGYNPLEKEVIADRDFQTTIWTELAQLLGNQ